MFKRTLAFLFIVLASSILRAGPVFMPAQKMVAGIEVGAKGVKFVLLDVIGKKRTESSYKILKDSSVNTDFISFNQAVLQQTTTALTGLYRYALNELKLSPSRIFVVISSGVQQSAVYNKKTDYLDLLSNNFIAQINEPGRKVPVISPEEESEFSMLGAIDDNILTETLLLDIGSGNTKGGFYNETVEDFAPCYISWGTKSIANEIKNTTNTSADAASYLQTLDAFFLQTINPSVKDMVTSRAGLTEKSNNFFSGGIAWAVMNCMLTGKTAEEGMYKTDIASVAAFRNKIRNAFINGQFNTSFFTSAIPAGPQKEVFTATINDVFRVYNEKDLICGTELLYNIIKLLVAEGCTGSVLLTTKGKYGWMPGYILANNE